MKTGKLIFTDPFSTFALVCALLLLPVVRAAVAETCGDIYSRGNAAYEQADYSAAIKEYEAARNCLLKLYGEETVETAICINETGLMYYSLGDYERALENYNKALGIKLKVIGEEHPSTATSYNNIGGVYYSLGNYAPALENYNKALGIRLKVLGKEHTDTATSFNNIGMVYYSLGNYAPALENYNKALDIYLKILGEEHPSSATIYNNIGMVYRALGNYEPALENYNKALGIDLKAQGELHPGTAIDYNNVGMVFYSLGDYEQALENYNKALGIYLKILGEEHQLTAKSYNNIGGVYDSLGDFERALENYNKALGIRLKVLGKEHTDTAKGFNNIGAVYYSLGNYARALENYNNALEIYLKILGEEHSDTAVTFNNIGSVYDSLGDYEKALENYNKALGIKLKIFGEEHPSTATSYNNIGGVYDSLGDNERALKNYNKALGSLCGGAKTPAPADCRQVDVTVSAFWFRARALYSLKDYGESVEAYTNAAGALDRLRGAMKGEEAKKHQGAEYYEMFPEGVGAFAALARDTGGGDSLAGAIEFAEKGVGRVFMEMISRSRAEVDGGLPVNVIQEKQSLETRWRYAQDAVLEQEEKTRNEKNLSERKTAYENLALTESELKTFEARLLKDYPDYAELMLPQTRPLAEIRDTVLAPGEAALEFLIGKKTSYLILISRDSIKIEELPPAAKIESLVDLFRKKLMEPTISKESLITTATKLFDMLLGPLKQELAAIDRLLIAPTGKLYFLPFEALVVENKYLAEKYEIRYAPSLNVMYLAKKRADGRADEWKKHIEWLGFGDPVYEESDNRADPRGYSENTRRMLASYTRALTELDNEHTAVWRRIPGAGIETEAIAALFDDERKELNLGLAANENKFKSSAPRGNRYIHVASHGTLGEGGAQQPAVVLSLLGNENISEDGFLTMTEIFNMKTPAEMVVLSACKTGQGRMEKGEGVAGLSRAFIYAGADSLIVSLWSVADEETKDLMVSFYQKLKSGVNKETALTETKREMIKHGLHPYYWAPFVFIGAN